MSRMTCIVYWEYSRRMDQFSRVIKGPPLLGRWMEGNDPRTVLCLCQSEPAAFILAAIPRFTRRLQQEQTSANTISHTMVVVLNWTTHHTIVNSVIITSTDAGDQYLYTYWRHKLSKSLVICAFKSALNCLRDFIADYQASLRSEYRLTNPNPDLTSRSCSKIYHTATAYVPLIQRNIDNIHQTNVSCRSVY